MVQQIIATEFNITSFLENGALLQLASDQFKLITGPFTSKPLSNPNTPNDTTGIYQPYFWDFLKSENPVRTLLQGESEIVLTRAELVQRLQLSRPAKPQTAWQNVESEGFKDQFEWSQKQFAKGGLLKTVPIISQRCKTNFGSKNLAWVLKHLITEPHFGWAYGFWQNGEGYLGQTPELVAQWNNAEKVLKTAALAGTVKNAESGEQQILADAKIRQEHNFVVEDILQNLNKVFSNERVLKEKTGVLELKHLIHLKTDFICKQIDFDQAFQGIQALHPTAALGVYPRHKKEMQIFSEMNLQNRRKRFAAPFAMIDSENILCVAAIRNFCFTQDELIIISGCGVTRESIFESELSELQMKRESVKRMMGLDE